MYFPKFDLSETHLWRKHEHEGTFCFRIQIRPSCVPRSPSVSLNEITIDRVVTRNHAEIIPKYVFLFVPNYPCPITTNIYAFPFNLFVL